MPLLPTFRRVTPLIALVLAAGEARADSGAVAVMIDGDGADHAAITTDLAGELARAVAPIPVGGPCDSSCLRITIEGRVATVRYAAPGGDVRERTVELPADAREARAAIVLLAGNLVRDEAAQLLAALSAAELPAPAPSPVPAPRVERLEASWSFAPEAHVAASVEPTRERLLGFGIVPPLTADLQHVGKIRHRFSLNAAVGVSAGVDAVSISGAVDVQLGRVRGAQIAGAVNVARDVDGAQIGGAVSAARDLRGAQIAGAVNVARDLRGVQIAGAVNVARDADVQIAGAVNVAKRARLQIGVINVSSDPDVIPIGVFSIVRGGRTDVEATIDTHRTVAALLRHGGRRWHAVYGVGSRPDLEASGAQMDDAADVWMYGVGMGPTWTAGEATIDVDAMAWQVNHGAEHDDELSLLTQLRGTVAWHLSAIDVVGGVAANCYISTRDDAPHDVVFRASGDLDDDDDRPRVRVWPTAFVGIRY